MSKEKLTINVVDTLFKAFTQPMRNPDASWWMHPQAYRLFVVVRDHPIEHATAMKLNERCGKPLTDKRTRGWRLIRPFYESVKMP